MQFIEAGRSYTTTQLLLDGFQPKQVVVVGSQHHEVMGATGLNQIMAASWSLAQLPRCAFDDTKGILIVEELASGSEQGTAAAAACSDKLCKSHYLGFGAAGALLQFVRQNMGLMIVPKALRVSRVYHRSSATA
jgi:hypothetical protein